MLKVYVIEDEIETCKKLYFYAKTTNSINIIGHTDNMNKAIDAISRLNPDAIILDIELTQGCGNGLELLNYINKFPKNKRPYVLVTTHTINHILYDSLHANGAALVLCKQQPTYSELDAINHLKLMEPFILQTRKHSNGMSISETEDIKDILSQDIFNELSKIGIKTNVLGFTYLASAIYYAIFNPIDSMLEELSNIYSKSRSSIEHSMRNSIKYCWTHSPISVLEANYNGFIHLQSGCPTTLQFITYYAEKLKNKHKKIIDNIST